MNDDLPKEIERLVSEWVRLISNTRLKHRGNPFHFEDSLKPILSAHRQLLVTARKIVEENERLKAEVPTGLSIARGKRLESPNKHKG